ncbi:MAG: ribokinase [Phenylobacterium sp.]|uniref:ribokinase n=1 Tax=Phenylobacterium sp. TaxID=1871053 RepID=UPI00391E0301
MSVCVLGGINLDHVVRVTALPAPGETAAGRDLAVTPGGKAANQAVAAARFGARARLLGAVGQDAAGAQMLAFLARAGVDASGVTRLEGQTTGQAFITIDRAGRNTIVVAAGANAAFLDDHVRAADLGGARVLLTQLEATLPAVEALFRAPAAADAVKILNAAPALEEAAPLLPLADIVVVNEIELARFAGLEAPPAGLAAATAAARRLLARPDQTVVATLGAEGALAVTGGEAIHAPGRRAEAVDTVGAGDCFCGVLAAALAEGLGLEPALSYANAAASIAVTRRGAAESAPRRAEVERLVGVAAG